MDFIDPQKKRAHRIRLYIGYFLMSIAIALGTLVLLFLSFGYNLDTNSGTVIQDGLIFVDSQPQNASIYVNGVIEKAKTGTRLGLPEGKYTIELQKDGYRSWKRTLNLDGGSIERIVYPILFPSDLTTKDRQTYTSQPSLAINSLDRHWIFVQQPNSMTAFDVIDASDPKKATKSITLPADMLTSAKTSQNLQFIEWSSDNRHILLRHNFDDSYEYVIVDIEDVAKSINLTKTLSLGKDEITLRDKKFNDFYVHDPNTKQLSTASINSPTLVTILDNVLAYKSHSDNMLLYTTISGATSPDKVSVMIRENDKSYSLRELPSSGAYLLDLAKFDNDWLMVAGSQSDNKVYVYKNPLDTLKQQNPRFLLPAFILRIDNPQFVSFSNNTEFIAVQNGPNFVIYDARNDRQYKYTLDIPLSAQEKAIWMDGDRLTITKQSKSVIWDYDGINEQVLSPAINGSRLMFDRDYATIYNLANSSSNQQQFAITSTSLKTPADSQ